MATHLNSGLYIDSSRPANEKGFAGGDFILTTKESIPSGQRHPGMEVYEIIDGVGKKYILGVGLLDADWEEVPTNISELPEGVMLASDYDTGNTGDSVDKAILAEGLTNGLSWDEVKSKYIFVRLATTTNLTVSGGTNLTAPDGAIDGKTLVNDDWVLVKNQTDAKRNGLYRWNGSVLFRNDSAVWWADTDTNIDRLNATLICVYVFDGATNRFTRWNWELTLSGGTWSIGVDAINFTNIKSALSSFPLPADIMLKSVYDTDNNNMVDLVANAINAVNASNVPWDGVYAKPITSITVDCKTTANITLNGVPANATATDGHQTAAGSKVLVASQINKKQNGVYLVVDGNPWSHLTLTDMIKINNSLVYVTNGAKYKNTSWVGSCFFEDGVEVILANAQISFDNATTKCASAPVVAKFSTSPAHTNYGLSVSKNAVVQFYDESYNNPSKVEWWAKVNADAYALIAGTKNISYTFSTSGTVLIKQIATGGLFCIDTKTASVVEKVLTVAVAGIGSVISTFDVSQTANTMTKFTGSFTINNPITDAVVTYPSGSSYNVFSGITGAALDFTIPDGGLAITQTTTFSLAITTVGNAVPKTKTITYYPLVYYKASDTKLTPGTITAGDVTGTWTPIYDTTQEAVLIPALGTIAANKWLNFATISTNTYLNYYYNGATLPEKVLDAFDVSTTITILSQTYRLYTEKNTPVTVAHYFNFTT